MDMVDFLKKSEKDAFINYLWNYVVSPFYIRGQENSMMDLDEDDFSDFKTWMECEFM